MCRLFFCTVVLFSVMSCAEKPTIQECKELGMLFAKGEVKKDEDGNLLRHGKWEYYYENGLIRVTGEWDHAKPKTNLCNYEEFMDEQSVGTWTFWRKNGAKEEEVIIDRVNNTTTTTKWHQNGAKESESVFDLTATKYISETSYSYDEKGNQIRKNFTKDEIKIDVVTSWYDNGKKRYEYTRSNDPNDPVVIFQTQWHENGQKSVEENVTRKKEGSWRKRWDEQGNVIAEDPGVAATVNTNP